MTGVVRTEVGAGTEVGGVGRGLNNSGRGGSGEMDGEGKSKPQASIVVLRVSSKDKLGIVEVMDGAVDIHSATLVTGALAARGFIASGAEKRGVAAGR